MGGRPNLESNGGKKDPVSKFRKIGVSHKYILLWRSATALWDCRRGGGEETLFPDVSLKSRLCSPSPSSLLRKQNSAHTAGCLLSAAPATPLEGDRETHVLAEGTRWGAFIKMLAHTPRFSLLWLLNLFPNPSYQTVFFCRVMCGHDKICTAVGPLSKALNPTLLQGVCLLRSRINCKSLWIKASAKLYVM